MREKRELNETELENAVGGVNWELFSNCLVDNSAENDPELAEIMAEINKPNRDYITIAIMTVKLLDTGNPLIVSAFNAAK